MSDLNDFEFSADPETAIRQFKRQMDARDEARGQAAAAQAAAYRSLPGVSVVESTLPGTGFRPVEQRQVRRYVDDGGGSLLPCYLVDMTNLTGGDTADVFMTSGDTWQFYIYYNDDGSGTTSSLYPPSGDEAIIIGLKLDFTARAGGVLTLSGGGHDSPDNGVYDQQPPGNTPVGTYVGGANGGTIYVTPEPNNVTRPPD